MGKIRITCSGRPSKRPLGPSRDRFPTNLASLENFGRLFGKKCTPAAVVKVFLKMFTPLQPLSRFWCRWGPAPQKTHKSKYKVHCSKALQTQAKVHPLCKTWCQGFPAQGKSTANARKRKQKQKQAHASKSKQKDRWVTPHSRQSRGSPTHDASRQSRKSAAVVKVFPQSTRSKRTQT